jgi:hypothetical protein
MPSLSDLLGQAQVKEPVTEEISRLKLIVDEARLNLQDAENKRDDLKQKVLLLSSLLLLSWLLILTLF